MNCGKQVYEENNYELRERERDYGDDNANDGKNSGNNDNGAVTENACFSELVIAKVVIRQR